MLTMRESTIAPIAGSIGAGSFMVALLVLWFIVEVPAVVLGGTRPTPYFWPMVVYVAAFVLWMFLITTLSGKHRSRRLFSWSYSVLFHGLFVVLLLFLSKGEVIVLLLTAPEILVVLLSLIGLALAFHAPRELTTVQRGA